MSLDYGWNWTGEKWLYKRVPVNIWSPAHEAADHNHVKKRHQEFAETDDGKLLDEFVDHVKNCPKCNQGKAWCRAGGKIHTKLDLKWRVWISQLKLANEKNVAAHLLYDCGFQAQASSYGYHP